jgi:hypothetical protein
MSPLTAAVKVRPMNDATKHQAQAETGSRVHRRKVSSS